MFIYNLIMVVCFCGSLGLVYTELRNQTRHQKGLLLGVTLPKEADALPEVLETVRKFRFQLNLCCILALLSVIPLLFVRDMAISLTLWMLWLFGALFLPYLPYFRANKKLKELKRSRGWSSAPSRRIVDTAASEFSLPKPIGIWTLLFPLVVSLIPALLPGQLVVMRWVYLADTGVLVLLWGCGRWLFRRRADMVTDDSDCNQTLVRVRRIYWDRFWRLNLWSCGLMNLCMFLFQNSGFYLVVALLLTLLILFGTLWMELSVRRVQEHLTANASIIADEDDAWLGGAIYYNPSDDRFMVAKRLGIGTTVNFATKGGKAYLIFLALVLSGCLLIGPILGMIDHIPTRLNLTDSTLVALHGEKEKYEISLDGITSVELRDTLPESTRIFGAGMEHYLEGDFSVKDEGVAKFCLDPTEPPFLRIEQNGKVYWFTSETPQQTREIKEKLDQLS